MEEHGPPAPSEAKPTLVPPEDQPLPSGYSGRQEGRPQPLSSEELAMTGTRTGTEGFPTAEPPIARADAGATGGWQRNRQVAALWANDEERNTWIYAVGVGWVRLVTSSDAALLSLSMLSAHARQTLRTIDYRTGDDGLVHEIYAW